MKKFDSIDFLKDYIKGVDIIEDIAIQSLDLREAEDYILSSKFNRCLILGCKLSKKLTKHLIVDNFIFPRLHVPFNTYPSRLYNKDSLFNDFDYMRPDSYSNTLDKLVYDYYRNTLDSNSIIDTLAQRLHDHSITDSLTDFISKYDERRLVAIMGGHRVKRTDEIYLQVARLSKTLTENGHILLSGGGPGIMEATHFGAWMAGLTDEELLDGLSILEKAPIYSDDDWLATSFKVIDKYPNPKFNSIGIPTWHYGHELPTPFATHIAKYFENSVREEGLLAIAKGGVIFTPGSAGTMQEVFQDLAQNHYESYGYASPMIFLNVEFWTQHRPIFPIIQQMSDNGDLMNLNLGLYDKNEDVIKHLNAFLLNEIS